ncbi:PepSY domain-containing protein [Streptomyces sp. NPDC059017]|uniref:PepSY domain-containing protein n=1 Tax=unclassified Streptomyces TaxID=2593676 RepID=UPI003686F540
MNESLHALRTRTVLPACLVVCSALLLAGCGSGGGTKGPAAVATPAAPTGVSPTGSPDPTGTGARLTDDQVARMSLVQAAKVPWDEAADTAVGTVSGGKLVGIELRRYKGGATTSPAPDPGSPEWTAEVGGQNGMVHRVLVDGVSGTVLRSQPDTDQDADDMRELTDRLTRAQVSPEQAVKTATDRKQGIVTDVHLSDEDNTLVWSVDVVNQQDWSKTAFDIDAATGEVLREQVDKG